MRRPASLIVILVVLGSCAADDEPSDATSGTTSASSSGTIGPATTSGTTGGGSGDTSTGTGGTTAATTGPPADPYGDCKVAPDCPVFGVCGESLVPDARGCRPDCGPGCPPAQGGTATPTCLDTAPTPFCYLPCTAMGEQAECPDGMVCATNTIFSVDMCGWPVG